MRIRHAILAFVVVLHACRSSAEPGVSNGGELPSGAVALQVRAFPDAVTSVLYSGVPDRRRVVIRDAAAWQRLWDEVTEGQSPRPTLPAVDFAQEEVIVAAMGTKPSGGFAIAIEGVYESGGRRYVVVRETVPGSSCAATGALTSPLAAVRVARSTAPASYVEKQSVRNC